LFSRDIVDAKLGQIRAARMLLFVIAKREATKQSRGSGLLRFARNDGDEASPDP
jgi:hypothetical protein